MSHSPRNSKLEPNSQEQMKELYRVASKIKTRIKPFQLELVNKAHNHFQKRDSKMNNFPRSLAPLSKELDKSRNILQPLMTSRSR
jgi:hypothetical protein